YQDGPSQPELAGEDDRILQDHTRGLSGVAGGAEGVSAEGLLRNVELIRYEAIERLRAQSLLLLPKSRFIALLFARRRAGWEALLTGRAGPGGRACSSRLVDGCSLHPAARQSVICPSACAEPFAAAHVRSGCADSRSLASPSAGYATLPAALRKTA